MTCEELLQTLNEYIDDETIISFCHEFAEHLSGCHPCQVVIDNIRHSIQLYQAGEPFPLPEAFRNAFRKAMQARWQEKFSESQNR